MGAPGTATMIKTLDNSTPGALLVYASNGFGKTSLARDYHSEGGKSLILAADSNYRPLKGRRYVVDVENWEQFALAVEKIPYGEYDSIAVDTITQVIDLVQAHECRRLNIEHPSDAEFGKGWQAMRVELGRVLTKLELRAKSVLYLAQEDSKETTVIGARKIVKNVAMLAEKTGLRVRAATSLIGRIEIDPKTNERTVNFRPRMECEGKDTAGLSAATDFKIPASGAALWKLVNGPESIGVA